MNSEKYSLRSPQTPGDWNHYHTIRREVLWERRGKYDYAEDHPDEHKVGNHPLLLTYENIPVGVVRIDVSGKTAILRRVAVRDDVQRLGHGRVLLALAEFFAIDKGCDQLSSYVSPDAVGFYEKCGFRRDLHRMADPHHVPMDKYLKKEAG